MSPPSLVCRRDHRINGSKARRVEENLLETAAAASNAERELQEQKKHSR